MKDLKFLFVPVLMSLLLFNLSSQENQDKNEQNQMIIEKPQNQNSDENLNSDEKIKSQVSQGLTVTKINFSGLKKTKNFYIQSKVKKFLGVSAEEFDLHALETTLQLENLFDDIQISMENSGAGEASVEVSVKEKITFIPLPFAMYSDSGFMGGLMVMDTNAFGVKDMFVFGGLYSKSSVMGMAVFSKPPKDNGIPGFSVSLSTSKNTSKIENLDKDEVLEYKSTNLNSRFMLTEKIGELNLFSFGGFFNSVSAKRSDDFPEIDSIKSAGFSAGWSVSKSDWNGWFLSSSGAGVSTDAVLYADKSDYKNGCSLSVDFHIQKPVFSRARFYSAGSAFYGKDLHISSRAGGKSGSVAILPGNFRTEEIAGGNAGLEFAIAKGKIGTVSVYGDYQIVSAQDYDDEFYFMHGPNGGVKVYLAKIAFPALSMGFSYNVTKRYANFAAALGISM